jgi:hypothetical protein
MGFNAIFNNISVISWWPFLLVEGTGVHGENHRLDTSQQLSTTVKKRMYLFCSCLFILHSGDSMCYKIR